LPPAAGDSIEPAVGSVEIEPSVLLPVGGEDTLAFLSCGTCLPSWEINQGLSEVPNMTDISHWGVMTIGTGLGNARFTNRTDT
jgi:hypothetical protein